MQTGDSSGESDHEGSPLLGSRVGGRLGSRVGSRAGNSHSSPLPPRPNSAIGVPSTVLEPPNVYRSRWRSIRVMYLTMFLGSVTFTITMSSLWPFLQVLDPSVDESFLGWVVAAYSVGQLAASPFFGGWANFRQSSREPLTVSLALTTISNLFYMYLQSVPSHREYYLILARGLIGFSAGNVAVVRSYVSGATTLKERTSCMANVSIFQAMGFILGPVIQAALVPIAYPGPAESPGFHFNMYTAPAFFAVCVAGINLLLLIFVFKEHRVYDDDVNTNVQGSAIADYRPDYVAVLSTIFLFFVVLFMFTVFETIGTPLTMHMYAWSKSKATLYQGIILGVAGALSIVVFMFVKILAKRFNERYLLFSGFIFCLCGYFIFIPWGSDLPPRGYAPITNSTHPSGQEAMFTFLDDLFTGNLAHDISKREAIFDDGQPAYVENFEAVTVHPKFQRGRALGIVDSELKFNPLSDSREDSLDTGQSRNLKAPLALGNMASLDMTTFGATSAPNTTNSTTAGTTTSNGTTITTTSSSTTATSNSTTHNGTTATTVTTTPYRNTTSIATTTTSRTTTTSVTTTSSGTTATTSKSTTTSTTSSTTTPRPTNTTSSTTSRSTNTTSSTTSRSTNSTTHMSTTSSMARTSTTTISTTTTAINTTEASHNSTASPEGCPWDYSWCGYVPVIHLAQYLIGVLLISVGYPMCNMLTYTIYSKVLGPKPQGLWMGWLTAAGSLARTVGPVYVSQVYDSYGPQVTFGSCCVFILVTIGFFVFIFRRLVPFSFKDESLSRFGGSSSVKR